MMSKKWISNEAFKLAFILDIEHVPKSNLFVQYTLS
jgi:hypothetical protein